MKRSITGLVPAARARPGQAAATTARATTAPPRRRRLGRLRWLRRRWQQERRRWQRAAPSRAAPAAARPSRRRRAPPRRPCPSSAGRAGVCVEHDGRLDARQRARPATRSPIGLSNGDPAWLATTCRPCPRPTQPGADRLVHRRRRSTSSTKIRIADSTCRSTSRSSSTAPRAAARRRADGWKVVETVTGNDRNSRQRLLDLDGAIGYA